MHDPSQIIFQSMNYLTVKKLLAKGLISVYHLSIWITLTIKLILIGSIEIIVT